MHKSATSVSNVDNTRPSPSEFDLYLPWACMALQQKSHVQVYKVYQNEYVSAALTDRSKKGKSKSKFAVSKVDVATDEKEEKSTSDMTIKQIYDLRPTNIVTIQAIYDLQDNLVHIKFDKNSQLPRVIIKIIGLILQFQPYISTITINSGLDIYTLYEICKFLPTIHITELCLDGCYLKEPNYYLLFENTNFLKCFSLCRCKIDDIALEAICSKLVYPLPGSKTLSVLNLTSNRITDKGAKSIADFLRSNRQLSYLNLASNMITDKGASEILNILAEFPLTTDEALSSRTRYMEYVKTKNEMIGTTIKDLRMGDFEKRIGKRKSMRPTTIASAISKKVKLEPSMKSLADESIKLADIDSVLIERATAMVETVLGEFVDPFNKNNTIVRDGTKYCKGNNALCCLNMSYNDLSYLSLKEIEKVLIYQQQDHRIPRGLVSLSVEGNSIPIACKVLTQIDNLLETNLSTQTRKISSGRKKSHIIKPIHLA